MDQADMDQTTVIRAATDGDVRSMAALLAELFDQEAEFAPDAAAQARGLRAILADPRTGRLLVAEGADGLVGMVSLLYTVSTALGGRVALLEDMVVSRQARGSGIGGRLLQAAIDQAKADGAARITLLTDHDNRRAHAFYQAGGFTRSQMAAFRRIL